MSEISTAIQFEKNKTFGVISEIIAILDFQSNGYHVRRTGIGSDFIAFRKISDGLDEMYVEVKYGKATLSSLQKRQKFLAKKSNMKFFEYRVTQKYLENFIEENRIDINNINPNELRESIYDYKIKNSESNFKVTLPWTCPNCEKTNAITQPELVENFGLRKMSDGTIRNQSWCRRCR